MPSRRRTYPVLLALPNKVFTSFPSHRTEYIQHFAELQDTLIFRPATCIHYSMRICASAPSFPRKMMNSIRGQHPSHSLLFYWKIPFSFTHLWVFTPLARDERNHHASYRHHGAAIGLMTSRQPAQVNCSTTTTTIPKASLIVALVECYST